MNTDTPTHEYTRAQLEAALRRAGDTDTPKDVALLRSWDPLLTISIDQIAASILAAHMRRVDKECHAFAMGPKVSEAEAGQAKLGAHLLRMLRGEDLP
jgi:hypothetical protein